MWVALFTSESCDHYMIGPFSSKPTPAQIFRLFQSHHEEEAEYLMTMLTGKPDADPERVETFGFQLVQLPDIPAAELLDGGYV